MSREVAEEKKQVIANEDDLLTVFIEGARPKQDYKIGVEFERFVLDEDTGRSLPYAGAEKSIEQLLQRFLKKCQWEPIYDQGALISLTRGGSAITLEPGGQLEISASAHAELAESCKEILSLVKAFDEIGKEMGVFYARTGVPPITTMQDAQWVPKSRYQTMRSFHGKDEAFLEMMTVTASVQVNYDYSSEQDCADKIRASSYLAPVLAALYANSFYEGGQLTGYATRRMQIWDRLNPDRSGIKPFFVDGSFGFEKYKDYMLDVPMYFVSRGGKYIDVGHQTFRNYLRNKPLGDILEQDWLLHLTTTFPEVRLKNHLEFRSIDSHPLDIVISGAAMIKGLIYSDKSLQQTIAMFEGLSAAEVSQGIRDVATDGMQAVYAGKTVACMIGDVFALAKDGLPEREQKFLTPILPFVERGISPAEEKMQTHDFSDPAVWKLL